MARYLPAIALALTVALPAVASAAPLQIVAEDYAPASFERGGMVAGIDVDVARAVFGRLGIPVEIHLYPWARAYQMLKDGSADVGLHVSYTEERARFVLWPATSVWQADFVFMTNAATKVAHDLRSYADVRASGLTIGIINENAYDPSFWAVFPSPERDRQVYDPQLEPAKDAATNLRKLDADRIQLFPIARILGLHLAREMALQNVTYYDWVAFSKPYPNAFSKQSRYRDGTYRDIGAVMRAYDAALSAMKQDEPVYRGFIERYEAADR